MKRQNISIFRLPGSYIGLFIGMIISLQIKNNRMFLLEGRTDFDCNWNLLKELSCSNLALISIILFLITGFVVGGFIHKKQQ